MQRTILLVLGGCLMASSVAAETVADVCPENQNPMDQASTVISPTFAIAPHSVPVTLPAQPPKSDPQSPADSPISASTPPNNPPEAVADSSTPDPKKKQAETPPSPEEIARFQLLAKADRYYQCGDRLLAERFYREVKKPFAAETQFNREMIPETIYEPENMTGVGKVYWRLYQEGLENEVYVSKRLTALKLLTEKYPEYIPGHLIYAEALKNNHQSEESRLVLEKALTLYPNEIPLVKAQIATLEAEQKWLEASLLARQFALLNPDQFVTPEFTESANKNLANFQATLREKMTWNALGNALIGGLGYALTGNLLGPLSAVQTGMLLMQGESNLGNQITAQARQQLPMLKDEEVLAYIREIGHKLAKTAGRDEFQYEFYVILDERFNAFALPGGKVFINAGAIAKTESEAEIAGLLAHEIAHSVLSHGFQLMTQGALTDNITQYIPYVGGIAGNLLFFNYSREMEEQADQLGTRLLANSGYAADGVRNLLAIMAKEDQVKIPAWLSTHPETRDRVTQLEELIVTRQFNRYSYEGVERQKEIQEKVKALLAQEKEKKEGKGKTEATKSINQKKSIKQ
ncbi:MAG: M48 family metalloprotease [Snowella sp.]|nr:M48 family metalloprotease [Snowella sp.]